EALGRLGEEKVLKQLLVYASSGYADDRLIAISGLEYLGGPDVFAMLTTLADDPQIEVQLAAIRALGKLADETNLELVRQCLHYEDPEGDTQAADRIRGLAILALGRIGKKTDSSLLYRAMADRSQYLRLAAARATIDYLKRKDR
ncbi:MAG TPA: HEAT repeat domain-containing protein, partial [Anaerohalosphaeraceae bacterium]|nr:HEAT repeat domain-containing protein [Anaerohalosphaeraceae bacterium]